MSPIFSQLDPVWLSLVNYSFSLPGARRAPVLMRARHCSHFPSASYPVPSDLLIGQLTCGSCCKLEVD
uniref:Uncharacterized protein n=1 Tax=Rhizoctonia solani TaxID=456999 RepID=N0A579_9AGAM|nr:hypothetical protein RSOL_m00740 [Rhizoctonia solani]AGK45402.1 hypothetical protein RSOL_m00740 [Rhizoctonia solani]